MRIEASVRVLTAVVSLWVFAAPGVTGAERTGTAQSATALTSPPTLRLPQTAQPVRYAADLTVVPTDDSFAGTVDIDLVVKQATSILWLNGTRLTIREATLSTGGKLFPATALPGGEDFVGFAFERAVPAGAAKLHVVYTGELNRNETNGLFKEEEGGDWYVYSQFEATDARKSFPCFDEPSYKTPWQLTLRIRRGDVAISNTPVISESESPDGLKIVRFAETKPLPTYLVAIGVGPFDVVDAGRAGMRSTPVRIITPRGRGAEARYAARVTPAILNLLESYFGIPYPYEKLDNMAIPTTVGFGAMENAGLITYRMPLILAKPDDETIRFARAYASVCAHEAAHQWFGDLVTMAWWDDVWLNESFATWMGTKIVDEWKPEWKWKVDRVGASSWAMAADTLVSARKIRQPIVDRNDIANAFDTITYSKGAAVLAMFEGWMGDDRFRSGVRRYLKTHAFGSATADDFLAALNAEVGSAEVGHAFASFLDQAGVPLLSVEVAAGAGGAPELRLTQRRFLTLGSTGSSRQTWEIPVCIRYSLAGKEQQARLLMKTEKASLPLGSAGSSPEWVVANDQQEGYYRVLYNGDLHARLLKDAGNRLSESETVGILKDAGALADSGALSMRDVLELVPVFARTSNRQTLESTMDIVESLRSHFVTTDLRPHYAAFIQAVFGERARAAGFVARPADDDDTKLLRPRLLRLAADDGADAALAAEAGRLARQWLSDRHAVDSDLVPSVLQVAAAGGTRELFESLRAELGKTKDRRERQRILDALGSFRDPLIERDALALVLDDSLDPRESIRIWWAGLGDPQLREMAYEFAEQNYDALVARIPRDDASDLPLTIGNAFCDERHRTELEAFFKDRVTKLFGGPRNLAQALEHMELCRAIVQAQQGSVAEFLKRY